MADDPTEVAEELRRLSHAIRAAFRRLRRAQNRPHPNPELLDTIMTLLDDAISANTAAAAKNTTNVGELITALAAKNPEPTAEQLAAINANTAAIEANNADIANALAPPATPTLTLSPASVSAAVGVASSDPVAITGGNGPYSLVSPPAGMTYDGTNVAFDGTQTAFSGGVTVQDASTPPETGVLAVTIQ